MRTTNPGVLNSLFIDIFPHYKEIWGQIQECETSDGREAVRERCEKQWGPGVVFANDPNDLSRWGMVKGAEERYRYYPEVASLRNYLVTWARRFHLVSDPVSRMGPRVSGRGADRAAQDTTAAAGVGWQNRMPRPLTDVELRSLPAEWVMNVALKTLKAWAEVDDDGVLDWAYPVPGITPIVGVVSPPRFESRPWQPQIESRAVFRQRYLEECTKRLDQYLNVLETRAQQIGLEPEKRRRKPRNDRQSGIPEDREFEWLALWQTAGVSYFEIQERYRFTETKTGYSQFYDESSIRKAIGTAAKRIGLTLRK